jgi:hypothetical protein
MLICSPTGHAERGPMTTFNDREKGFENKFAHDAEMQFKAQARANKLLGLWAANLLGKTGAEADSYATEVMKADFTEVGHEDVYRKLAVDLDYRADEATIRAKMAEALGTAKTQLMSEPPRS